MKQNRTRATIVTAFSNTGAQILIILLEFAVRSVFIYKLGEAYLGVSGLFQNILGILSLAELGLGPAITYYLYKPAATDDTERLKSLIHLYKRVFNLLGGLILLAGVLLMPFLPYLVNMEVELPVNLYIIYFLYLLNSSLTYLLFAYKTALFTAYQQMHKVAGIQSVTKVFSAILSVILLIVTQNFYAYLLCLITETVAHNLLLSHIADRNFPFLKEKEYTKVSRSELKEIFKNVYAAVVFKMGDAALYSTDNILISMLCGTVTVGYFSNYNLIVKGVGKFYSAVTSAILPSVGNLNAKESDEKQLQLFNELNFIHAWVLNFCSVSLMVLLQPFISLWTRHTGNVGYVLTMSIPVLLGLNFWIQSYMQIVGQYKNTKGLFWYGKYIQLSMGLTNVILSVIFGKIWGLFGIVAATTVSMLAISFLPFPYYLFHYGYKRSVLPFYAVCLKDFLLLMLGYGAVRLLSLWIVQTTVFTFIYQGLLCLIVPNLIVYLVQRRSPEMQMTKKLVIRILRRGR